MFNVKNDEFHYKLIHTPSQTVYANRPHVFQDGYKVFISTTSYYSTFVDNCGMTQSIVFIRCNDKEEARKELQILSGPARKSYEEITSNNFIEDQIKTWKAMIRVLDTGEHCPHHFRAIKAKL